MRHIYLFLMLCPTISHTYAHCHKLFPAKLALFKYILLKGCMITDKMADDDGSSQSLSGAEVRRIMCILHSRWLARRVYDS